ncbi:hypothetical protein NUSPORA_00102 [Nucleospora cyclopteri]
MISINDKNLDKNSFIDIVIQPDINSLNVIQSLINNENIIVFDTEGNIYHSLLNAPVTDISSKIEINTNSYTIIPIYSLTKLIKELEKLQKYNNFILVLDSITFVCDRDVLMIQEIVNILWNTIYTCNCTVICFNHYKIHLSNENYQLIPRMGKKYSNFISYRVFCEFTNEMEYSVIKFDI